MPMKKNPKSKNAKWSDQDDAFFGPTKPAPSPAASKQESRKNTNINRIDRNLNANKDNNDNQGKKKSYSDFSFGKQKERVSLIAEKASSKISGLVQSGQSRIGQSNEGNTGRPSGVARGTSQLCDRSTRKEGQKTRSSTRSIIPPRSAAGAVLRVAREMKKQNGIGKNNDKQPISQSKQVVPSTNKKKDGQAMIRTIKNVLVGQIPIPCAYCGSIPLMYQCHPFFGPSQRICSTHDFKTVPKCISCFRFQPRNKPFHQIGTTGTLLCPSCAETAILDNIAAKELYEEVLCFLQSYELDMFHGRMLSVPLALFTPEEMRKIFCKFKDAGSEDKYGVCCWSEWHSPLGAAVGLMGSAGLAAAKGMNKFVRNRKNKHDGSNLGELSSINNDNNTIRKNPFGGGRFVTITQVAALKGLPRIFLGEILAHEATHAWLALNPTRKGGVAGQNVSLGVVRRIPKLVEEGCCQLVAHLYLDCLSLDDDFADKLSFIQYRMWSIENHGVYEYGEGYKQATLAYNQLVETGGNLEDLLQYVSIHQSFPSC